LTGPAPTAQTDALSLRRYATTRDPQLREQLVERYLPLARFAASRYVRAHEPLDDLLQVASIGLLKALDRYEPTRGVVFASYALPTMHGELLRHFRDRSWSVRPPRDLQEQALRVERCAARLHQELGASPTVDQLAEATGLSHETVLEAREAAAARYATSLSSPARPDGQDDADGTLGARLPSEEQGYARAEERVTIEQLGRALTVRERRVLELRFQNDLTQQEIGEIVGISQMQVSRILRLAIDKLRLESRRASVAGPP
jgi:RNA polymerase sigma-B factor